jgi:hypothetical protein
MARVGWIMTALIVLFLVGTSAVPKLIGASAAIESMVALDWPPQYLLLIGTMELVIVILYAIPRTGLLGAVLMTALLGGALASHLRAGSPLLSHTLFSVYLGVFLWAALLLRDEALRAYVKKATSLS